jgi:putative salt-induced outer membrane protein
MSRYRSSLAALVVYLLSSVPVFADQVVLKNGDHLSGRVVEQNGESVALETDYAGAIKIAASHVDKVLLDASAAAESPVPARAVEPAENHKPTPKAAEPKRLLGGRYYGLADGWSGNANIGFSYTAGNSGNTTMTTGLRAVKSGGVDNLTIYARSLWNSNRKLAANNTTSNAYWGGARYDRNFGERQFAFGSYDFESDRPKKLNFRSVAGAGLGRHIIKSDKTELDVLFGGAWNHTWQAGSNSDSPEAVAGNSLKHKFNDKLKLQNNFTFYQNATDRKDFRYILETTLSVDVTKKIGWFITIGNRFNNDPVGTADKNDFLFTTGIRWNYGRKK